MISKENTNYIYDFNNKEEIILRDFLALERTRLANERTYFAYLRTSLYLALAGITLLEVETFANINKSAYIMFSLSIILFVFGTVRYIRLNKKLKKYYIKETEKSVE